MNIEMNHIYHVYNQGNNRITIFFEDEDYDVFYRLFRRIVSPKTKTLAYCLMPNHFHFLIYATEISARQKKIGEVYSCELSNAFRLLQSSYAQYINKKYERSGSLFRQKAKAKVIISNEKDYLNTAFYYIHQNPVKAGLVKRPEDWHYSSFPDYYRLGNRSLCDLSFTERLISKEKMPYSGSHGQDIDESAVQNIFVESDFAKY